MPAAEHMRREGRQKPSRSFSLYQCYRQGNRVESAAWKCSVPISEAAAWYMHFSLQEARSQLRDTHRRQTVIE